MRAATTAERPVSRPDQRFRCSPLVETVRVGSQSALFCGRTERLFELNKTAAAIWSDVASGRTAEEASRTLRALGATAQQAQSFLHAQLNEWLREGHIIPEAILARMNEPPSASLTVRYDELDAELDFYDSSAAGPAAAAFSAMSDGAMSQAGRIRISVVGEEDVDHLLLDGVPLGMGLRRCTLPRLKWRLTRELFRRADTGFFAHGALVSLAGKSVFLAGSPGAGKTTLTLALVSNGFAYGGDDTVRVSADGTAKGIPFPAAAKSGAWRLLSGDYPELTSLATHERDDGQLVRYVAPGRMDEPGFRRIDLFLRLDRRPRVKARLEEMAPLEALHVLFKSGYTERPLNRPTEVVRGLARNLTAATCARLIYGDLAEGVAVVRDAVCG